MLLLGGFGLAIPALTTLGMSGATAADAGLASGLFNTTQQVGAALGVAVLATLAAGRTAQLRARGTGAAAALAGGYHLAFAVGACVIAAALVLALVALRRTARLQPAAQAGPGSGAEPAVGQPPAEKAPSTAAAGQPPAENATRAAARPRPDLVTGRRRAAFRPAGPGLQPGRAEDWSLERLAGDDLRLTPGQQPAGGHREQRHADEDDHEIRHRQVLQG
jgi:hypothetical protein